MTTLGVCHVHVGVPGRDLAIEVGNRLRPWLPIVQALVGDLLAHAGAAMRRHGDRDLVEAQLARVRREGTGAARQRRLLDAGGAGAVLRRLAELTAAGPVRARTLAD